MTVKRAIRAGVRAEGGYSLPELLVAATVGLIVITGAMILLSNVVRSQPRTTERAGQVQQGRTMIERITRELRQAASVSTATASSLEMVTYADSANCGGVPASPAILCRVAYNCSASACTRTERNPDGSGTASSEQIVSGIRSASVFTYQPAADPTYVSVTLEFGGDDGAETITLSDGAAARNAATAAGGGA